ncbi:MAG: PIN domain-containing protein [Anaerolineae bacterium]|nr:PIN domain-containing protein [Anaerolineae bacterium]
MRALLDTDIVLDYLLSREPFVHAASEIWQAAIKGEFEAFVSAITPVNLYYVARKLKGDVAARRAVRGLLAVCRIATTDHSALQQALDLNLQDYEDAVQVASARVMSLDLVVTRNTGDYVGAELSVVSPDQFLVLLSARL